MRKKKSEKTKLIEKLDTKFSILIRRRDNYTCQKCGKKLPSSQCAHILTRGLRLTRWYMGNAITLCYYCHIGSNTSAHRDPVGFTKFIDEKFGENYINKLQKIAIKNITTNDEFFENIENYLNEVQKVLDDGGNGSEVK
jgi:hypothetical protein